MPAPSQVPVVIEVFNDGDTVYLRTPSPAMTLAHCPPKGADGTVWYICFWFVNGVLFKEWFTAASLTHVAPSNK